jgi:hypothetical protein
MVFEVTVSSRMLHNFFNSTPTYRVLIKGPSSAVAILSLTIIIQSDHIMQHVVLSQIPFRGRDRRKGPARPTFG